MSVLFVPVADVLMIWPYSTSGIYSRMLSACFVSNQIWLTVESRNKQVAKQIQMWTKSEKCVKSCGVNVAFDFAWRAVEM